MNDVLVTGAAGFLGQYFARWHIAQGDRVVMVDNKPLEEWPSMHDQETDRSLYKSIDLGWFLADHAYTYDLAYHFAAPVGGRVKIENDPMYNADALRLDSAFFRWAVRRVGLAIYPSSSAVYGTTFQSGRGQLLTEGMFSAENPNWFAPDELYGTTKLMGEYMAWKASEKYGLNTLCIRPFSGYGEGQSLDYPMPSICARAKRHEDPITVWGSGEQRRDFVHVQDIVGATQARLSAGIHGYQVMNIASGHGTSFIEIAKIAARIVGYSPTIQPDVSKPVGVSARYGDIARQFRYYGENRVSLEEGMTRVVESL